MAPEAAAPPHEQAAGADQRFLVGERNDGTAIGRGEGRLEPGRAGDRPDHPFGRPIGRLDQSALAGTCCDPGSEQRILELRIGSLIADRGDRAPSSRASAANAPALLFALTASTR